MLTQTPKIALAMIVKGSDDEASVLSRCLSTVADHVDGIYITITQPNKAVEAVAKKYNAVISHYSWNNHFADARNFNFAQVPKEFGYILWLDADDVLRGAENLHTTLENKKDVYVFNYLYSFDEDKNPVVVHIKSRLVKNDGCTVWAGQVHEDMKPARKISAHFVKDIEVLHLTDGQRIEQSRNRNLEIAKEMEKDLPNDPRSQWNLGNAHKACQNNEEAIEAFTKFLVTSESEEEKYITRIRMSEIYLHNKQYTQALEQAMLAIGMFPEYPDAYNMKGHTLFEMKDWAGSVDAFKSGIVKTPPQYTVMAYNPRDYDFYPLLSMAKAYLHMSMYSLAMPLLEACHEIMPSRDDVANIIQVIKRESDNELGVIESIERISKIEDKEELKKELDALPDDYKDHPRVCHLRNTRLIKEESSGKDLVIYCYPTEQVWTPETMKTEGMGGSEEAVIHLSKQLSNHGWNVTVYNNCGHKQQTFDGVTYKPHWSWNYRDKQDVVVLWRSPIALNYAINADRIVLDMHDAIPEGEFNEERINKLHKIFVKTNFHRSLYPGVPDEKFVIIPNGMDFGLFNQEVEKDQYLLVNTSSPDRSLDILPKLFMEVKKQVPEAKCKWAYGWNVFNTAHKTNKEKMKWQDETVKAMEEAGIENLGRVTQQEASRLYLQANILAYPTEFVEIDCLTVKKAQACGAIPVTTDFGALDESVKNGVKIHSTKTKDNWNKDYQFHWGLQGEKEQKEWVDAVVKILKTPITDRTEMKQAMEVYKWENIGNQWNNELCKK